VPWRYNELYEVPLFARSHPDRIIGRTESLYPNSVVDGTSKYRERRDHNQVKYSQYIPYPNPPARPQMIYECIIYKVPICFHRFLARVSFLAVQLCTCVQLLHGLASPRTHRRMATGQLNFKAILCYLCSRGSQHAGMVNRFIFLRVNNPSPSPAARKAVPVAVWLDRAEVLRRGLVP
jgi:hypothetical protein